MRSPLSAETSGQVRVRPPALVEAAAGVRAAARVVEDTAAALTSSRAGCLAFGAAQAGYAGWAGAWAEELALLVREAAHLATCVEAAALDYLRTDAAAAGAS